MMLEKEPSELYDAKYFEHGCGKPYKRDDHWLNFWEKIAGRINNEIQPSSVMDAGCAMGFLVEKLREKGVEANGIDISEYAISEVHESVRDFCRVGSVAEPFDKKYDLITCVEVLEHLPQDDAERAVANFCLHSDRILFSSTPLDYKEATHFNVQPPEVWSELFAKQGFFRDVDFDASFLTPWAVLYVKRDLPIHRIVRSYERKFWLLWKENTDLRTLVREINDLTEQNKQLRKINESHSRSIREMNEHLDGIRESRSWKFLQKVQRIRRIFKRSK